VEPSARTSLRHSPRAGSTFKIGSRGNSDKNFSSEEETQIADKVLKSRLLIEKIKEMVVNMHPSNCHTCT